MLNSLLTPKTTTKAKPQRVLLFFHPHGGIPQGITGTTLLMLVALLLALLLSPTPSYLSFAATTMTKSISIVEPIVRTRMHEMAV
jgi:hypothetical protein